MKNLPFSNIAISLSGGGYRATAFHLGTLSFLNQISFPVKIGTNHSLLNNVKILSTISGGTFTGMMWVYHNSQGKPFEECFQKLYLLLEEDKLIDAAFAKLNGKRKWNNDNKSRNLINAFSEVYNEDFFENATFASLIDKESKLTIDSITFNATEFKNGLAFRFQNNGFFGNKEIRIDQDVIGEVKLGDIVAASSCFPGGFEPLIFPNDFIQNVKSNLATTWNSQQEKPIALMDGGIIDNQGIDGIKLAADRFARKRDQQSINDPIDTYIASDVEGKVINPFDLPTKNLKKSKFTIHRFKKILWGVLIVSIILLFTSIWFIVTESSFFWIIGLIFASIFGFLSGVGHFLIHKISSWISQQSQSVVNQKGGDLLLNMGILLQTPIVVLRELIALRISSTLTMVNDVFLKRIRRIQYKSLYEKTIWKDKMIGNFLYSLEETESKEELSLGAQAIITQATSMPTTLWFSSKEKEEKMLDALIIAGQLTICYKLKAFVEKKQKMLDYKVIYKNNLKEMEDFHRELSNCLDQFNKEPSWLLCRLKNWKNTS